MEDDNKGKKEPFPLILLASTVIAMQTGKYWHLP